jgi:hypothetical protein
MRLDITCDLLRCGLTWVILGWAGLSVELGAGLSVKLGGQRKSLPDRLGSPRTARYVSAPLFCGEAVMRRVHRDKHLLDHW